MEEKSDPTEEEEKNKLTEPENEFKDQKFGIKVKSTYQPRTEQMSQKSDDNGKSGADKHL